MNDRCEKAKRAAPKCWGEKAGEMDARDCDEATFWTAYGGDNLEKVYLCGAMPVYQSPATHCECTFVDVRPAPPDTGGGGEPPTGGEPPPGGLGVACIFVCIALFCAAVAAIRERTQKTRR